MDTPLCECCQRDRFVIFGCGILALGLITAAYITNYAAISEREALAAECTATIQKCGTLLAQAGAPCPDVPRQLTPLNASCDLHLGG